MCLINTESFFFSKLHLLLSVAGIIRQPVNFQRAMTHKEPD